MLETNKLPSSQYQQLQITQLSRLLSRQVITIQTAEEIRLVNTAEIIYCSSAINYTHIWLLDKQKLVISKTLGDIEKQLTPPLFFRIHQSYLINILWLKLFKKGKGGSVIMVDDTKLEVASRKREAFIKHITRLESFV
jgi:two-component system LytT family response regulator